MGYLKPLVTQQQRHRKSAREWRSAQTVPDQRACAKLPDEVLEKPAQRKFRGQSNSAMLGLRRQHLVHSPLAEAVPSG